MDGNICGDPEVTAVGTEWTVLEFCVANNDNRKKEGDEWKTYPTFVNLKYWTKNPTPWIQKIVKGAYFAGTGKITQDDWIDKDTGKPRSKLVFTVEGLPTIRAPGGSTAHAAPAPSAPNADDDPTPF
jgi:single-stranded DNA-binding protein